MAEGIDTRRPPGRPKGTPKTGGRQKGTPNKATVEIREIARALVEDPAYVASLRERLIAGEAPHMETLLHHYAYGKPPERVEVSGSLVLGRAERMRAGRARVG